MTLEMDPRTGFAQREDKIGELLIPRHKNRTTLPSISFLDSQGSRKEGRVFQLVSVAFDDLYADWERYSLETPPGLVLVPGEIHINTLYIYTCIPCSGWGRLYN